MTTYNFTMTIDQYIDSGDLVEGFYKKVNDASIACGEGKTYIHFDREADSLDTALRTALAQLLGEGWRASEISVEPDCVRPLSVP